MASIWCQTYHGGRSTSAGRHSAVGGWAAVKLTLVETVRQDYDRRLTVFENEFVERIGRRRETRRFSITFRTLSVSQMAGRLERAGFRIDSVLGDYRGREWSPDADVWVILARKR